jgi:hypothetical protein
MEPPIEIVYWQVRGVQHQRAAMDGRKEQAHANGLSSGTESCSLLTPLQLNAPHFLCSEGHHADAHHRGLLLGRPQLRAGLGGPRGRAGARGSTRQGVAMSGGGQDCEVQCAIEKQQRDRMCGCAAL